MLTREDRMRLCVFAQLGEVGFGLGLVASQYANIVTVTLFAVQLSAVGVVVVVL